MNGRDELLTTLHKRFLAADGGGGVCVVSGSPGAGKTFLAERFLRELPSGTTRLRGRGLRTGVSPLLPICEAIRTCPEGESLERVRAVLEEYAKAVPFLKEALAPLVNARARADHARPELRRAMPGESFTFVVLARLLESLAKTDAPVLFLDDIQWVDPSSIGFLGYLATQIAERRVFLLLAHRLNGKQEEHVEALLDTLRREARERSVEISVGPLSRQEQRRCVEAMLGHVELEESDLKWLEGSSEGKPFQLREVIELLRAQGHLVEVRGVWRIVSRPTERLLPPSLQQYHRERLLRGTQGDALAQDAVQFGACAGTRFDSRIIAQALDQSPRRLGAALEAVQAATGLVRREGRTTLFTFDHDITRDAVLADLGDFAIEIHARLAATLAAQEHVEPSLVAYQFAASGDRSNAADWYVRASDAATRDCLFDAAVRYGKLADSLFGEAEAKSAPALRISLALGTALVSAEKYAEAVSYLSPRAEELSPEAAAPLRHLLGRAASRLPELESHQRAVVEFRSALAALPEGAEDATRARVWTDLIHAYDAVGDHIASRRAFGLAVAAAKRANDPSALVRLMRLTCILWQPEKVIEAMERAVEEASRHKLFYEVALCENNLGCARFALQELERAAEHYARSDAGLKKLGGYRRDTPMNNIGLVHLVGGDFDRARVFFDAAMSASLDPHGQLFIRSNLALVEFLAGDTPAAIRRLEAAVQDADGTGDLFYRDCLRHNLANAYLEVGRPEDAYATATACPQHHSTSDDQLVRAKRARLLVRALRAQAAPIPATLMQEAALLDRTTKPQAWLYRSPWYYCDIEFWED